MNSLDIQRLRQRIDGGQFIFGQASNQAVATADLRTLPRRWVSNDPVENRVHSPLPDRLHPVERRDVAAEIVLSDAGRARSAATANRSHEVSRSDMPGSGRSACRPGAASGITGTSR